MSITKSSLENFSMNIGSPKPRDISDAQMLNSWVNFNAENGTFKTLSTWIDSFGFGHAEGLVKGGTIPADVVSVGIENTPPRNVASANVVSPNVIGGVAMQPTGFLRCGGSTSATFTSFTGLHWSTFLTGWVHPSLSGSWADFSTTYYPLSYIKDPLGWVHIQGTIKNGSGAAFTLPSGYRPSRAMRFPIATNGGYGRLDITAAGVVTPTVVSGTNVFVSMSVFVFTATSSEKEYSWVNIPATSFANNWTHFDSAIPAQYMRDAHGMVHLRGQVKRSTGSVVSDETIFTLPNGYLPAARLIFPIDANGSFGGLDIKPNGDVISRGTTASATKTYLDGIRFKANLFT